MTNKYIGVTIGPIGKTFQSAKKTGQIWGASYIFSYVMKNMIMEIRNKDIVEEFILPYVDDTIFDIKEGVGLFPDRLIFKAKPNGFEKMSEIRDKVINELGEKVAGVIEENKTEVTKYLKEYFMIYFLEEEVKDGSPILKLTPYLDMLELQQNIINEENVNYLMELLKNKNVKGSFLTNDGFSSDFEKFDSIPDIAIRDIQQLDEIKSEIDYTGIDDEKYFEELYKKLAEKNLLKKHHKYVAIVQTDGDNIGEVIKNIGGDEQELKVFSEKLFCYAIDAVDAIRKKGGYPIYAGGDDLLFFAPIINGEKTIFDLLDSINQKLDNYFKQEKENLKLSPSLSFGVSITYYKYPLYEALEQASELLFNKAKKFKMNNKRKNAIAFQVIKHSGQVFGATIRNGSNSYHEFKKLIKCCEEKNDILQSILFRLHQDKELLKNILNRNNDMLDNYFANNFNEDIHEETKKKEFILAVKELIKKTHIETNDNIKSIDQVYSYLKFLKFLNEEN